MICEKCGKEFSEDWRKNKGKPLRFCSKYCSNSRVMSEEARKRLSVRFKTIKDRFCSECGIKISYKSKTGFCLSCYKIKNSFPETKYSRVERFCSICNTKLGRGNESGLCLNCHNHSGNNGNNKRKEAYLDKWIKEGNILTKGRLQNWVREYLFNKQNNVCAICGLKQEWNGRSIKFVLDHINGNSKDNNENNLRMICPNCDSQTDTFKNKNKGKGREYDKKYRLEYYHRNNNGVLGESGLTQNT